jgi:hypothetical protein
MDGRGLVRAVLVVVTATAFAACSSGNSTSSGATSGTSTAGTTGATGSSTTGATSGTTGTSTGGTTGGGPCFAGAGSLPDGGCCWNGSQGPCGSTLYGNLDCCVGFSCNSVNNLCGPPGASSTSGGSTGASTTGGTTGPVNCPVAAASQCATPGTAHPGSVVTGVAQLASGFTPSAGTKGSLVMFLTHQYEGMGAQGGVFHAEQHIDNVDLSKGPVPFQIDMCHNDIAMYSEDDCTFNLIVILDTNGNNAGTNNFVPDVGEATSRQLLNVSCMGQPQCVSATLGCDTGLSCVAFTDPTNACTCAPQTCNSDLVLCQH